MDIRIHDMLTLKAMAGRDRVVFSVGGWWHWHATCATHAPRVRSLLENYGGVRFMDTVPGENRRSVCDLCGGLLVNAPREE